MDIDTLQGLKRCPLFNGLKESEIIDLMHTVRYRVIRSRRGAVWAYEGSACQHADFIINGEMVAILTGPTGNVIRMGSHQSGKLLAPAFLFAADNHYPVAIEATTDTTILRLTQPDFEKLLHGNQKLMMNFIRLLSNIISLLTKKVSMLSMTVRDKVIFYLKELSRSQQTNNVILPLSRQELADHFGIQKYSLLRCLSELKQEGAIRVDGRHIQILSQFRGS